MVLTKLGELDMTIDDSKVLGVIFNPSLSFEPHIRSITNLAFFHHISCLRLILTDSVAETLIQALVISCLNYCIAILFELPENAINILQYIQNCCQNSYSPLSNSTGSNSSSHLNSR